MTSILLKLPESGNDIAKRGSGRMAEYIPSTPDKILRYYQDCEFALIILMQEMGNPTKNNPFILRKSDIAGNFLITVDSPDEGKDGYDDLITLYFEEDNESLVDGVLYEVIE
jgi:hypothetical protein